MNRTVKTDLINEWIGNHAPDGQAQLAVLSKVSTSTIGLARRGGVPKKRLTRVKLCRALNISEDDLFPLVGASGEKAS